MKLYCASPFVHHRRQTRVVTVGQVAIGGDNPVRVQSMLTCDTMDTATCVKQTLELVAAGCEMVRITAPTVKDAANLRNIKRELLAAGCAVPLVADIHFKPDAALEAAKWVEKVRVNPGNFADKKKFAVRDYNDAEYADELARIEESFVPLLVLCRERNVALRIGTNHGSLSDRIMNRYGDTANGMVESALEFARVARKHEFHNFLFSMKSSNPKVMINAYRLLAARLAAEGDDWNYPLHLGVTEAGEGEDGRIKSAIGIGSLLRDGLGDTIRVSLTEDSVHEIPVARELVAGAESLRGEQAPAEQPALSFDPYAYARRPSETVSVGGVNVGGENVPRVFVTRETWRALEPRFKALGDTQPEAIYEDAAVEEIDLNDAAQIARVNQLTRPVIVSVRDGTPLNPVVAYRWLAAKIDARHPILLKDTFFPLTVTPPARALLSTSTHLGALLCDGIGDAILVRQETAAGANLRLCYNLLQAAGNRVVKTEYVACPSCGRTLFNLQTTTARVKAATLHLKGVKIAIMGCIVNGPGEMADADFGYVGGAPGKINLYVGRQPVKFNIPETEAVERLIDLIREHGKWMAAPAT
ncbi:MAG: (E)-4-hydroxy-3-methylbut-2-enyl-diphosphate synthase [Verrucomicrobiales bacterium]|jgi:(E)-4-hydroxy-3-methylbut-2-enyl-diphosphate synthase|nr:(E)-4-hydroxy-3-methylbut-2-enyl-diphosphate synthase [Verrucomicrobiales bacterium]